jgi:hypothetical protein
MLCAKCQAKVAREAYYCKSCGEVIDDAIAPGLKLEDNRFASKLKYSLERHLIRNVVLGIFLILFVATGVKIGINYLQATKDNNSSAIYQLTVIAPQEPMTCRGSICHINFNIKNKSNLIVYLNITPDLVTTTGKKFSPADPNRMGNGSNYCQTKIVLTLQPHAVARYIGICAQDIPVGTIMNLAELRDLNGALVVSGVFMATVY